MRKYTAAIMILMLLEGCASTMSGLDGEAKFSCNAPEGVTCSSLSGVYANALASNLPGLRTGKVDGGKTENVQPTPIARVTPSSGMPIRSQPKVLRIWIAPWEDSEGDLHDQSYIYVVADPGRWLIEYQKKKIENRYRPTYMQSGNTQQNQANQKAKAPTGSVILPEADMYGQGTGTQALSSNEVEH